MTVVPRLPPEWGLLNVTRTLRGFRRSPAGGQTEFSAFAPVFRASDGGMPVALSTAVRRGK